MCNSEMTFLYYMNSLEAKHLILVWIMKVNSRLADLKKEAY